MMQKMIALHQMQSDFDPQRNIAIMMDAIKEASDAGAEIYFAPEMSILLDSKRKRAAAHIVDEAANIHLRALCDAACENDIWLQIGLPALSPDPDDARWVNRSLLISNKGKIAARYDKIHLFDVDLDSGESWHESKAYAPGKEAVLADTPLGKMGLTICYDLRFAELYAALSRAGADIISIPAAFTKPTGEAHWHSLIRARAIETQAFVVAAAQYGKHADGRETFGHSLVVDPWGEILLDMGEGEGLGFASIDPARLSEVRSQIPARENRRNIDIIKQY